MSTKLKLPSQTVGHRRHRYVVLGLVSIALAAAIYFGQALREQEPNYYDPARTALVNARLRIEESIGHEQALIAQLQMAHAELDEAIAQLAKAANLDPADRTRIDSLRSILLSIENPDHLGAISSTKLQQSYQDLLAQMEALITDMDKRNR
jgi:predicted Zn-dependent protease